MHFTELLAYKDAYEQAMKLFSASKSFPKSESYSLTDQIRRSSRAVCSCIAEAYRKRRYPAYFISKMSDADMENSETRVWLDFAKDCGYLAESEYLTMRTDNARIGRRIGSMLQNPNKYLAPQNRSLIE